MVVVVKLLVLYRGPELISYRTSSKTQAISNQIFSSSIPPQVLYLLPSDGDGGDVTKHKFEKPLAAVLFMFVGCMLPLPVYLIDVSECSSGSRSNGGCDSTCFHCPTMVYLHDGGLSASSQKGTITAD